jgi:hypothetical protein
VSGSNPPTNIAMYLWATLGARDLQLISKRAAATRLRQTLDSLRALERHEPSGQFYNWYDPVTLEKLTAWPEPPNDPVYPFLSSVDNGWLASALIMVSNAVPALREDARSLATSLDFGAYHDPLAKGADAGPGLLRGGFWRRPAGPSRTRATSRRRSSSASSARATATGASARRARPKAVIANTASRRDRSPIATSRSTKAWPSPPPSTPSPTVPSSAISGSR